MRLANSITQPENRRQFKEEKVDDMKGSEITQSQADSITTIAAKTAPPLTVSLATIGGVQVSEILLWATLIYTLMMIGHKGWSIYVDVFRTSKSSAGSGRSD